MEYISICSAIIVVCLFLCYVIYGKFALNKRLMTAVAAGNALAVMKLIDLGANVNAKNICGETALLVAKSDLNILEILLAAGADVNATNENKQTAVMLASKSGHAAIVKLLLDAGADINILDHQHCSSLMLASFSENTDIVNILLAAGATIRTRKK